MKKSAILSVVTFLVACGGGDTTGPKLPQLAGSYAADFIVDFSNAAPVNRKENWGDGAGIMLQTPDAAGNFSGWYALDGTTPSAGSGTIAGKLRPDGGISITQFGAPNQPGAAMQMLQLGFYWCDFTQASGSPLTGSVSGSALRLTGTITLPCTYQDSAGTAVTFPTTISETITGTRTPSAAVGSLQGTNSARVFHRSSP